MPLVTTLPTWFNINSEASTIANQSPTGFVDKRTRQPIYGGGLNVGDYFDLTEQEANNLSDLEVGILHWGRYRRVEVDRHSSEFLLFKGHIGTFVIGKEDNPNLVTTTDRGFPDPFVLPRCVFLNRVKPGEFAFVQELGLATCRAFQSLAAVSAGQWAHVIRHDGSVDGTTDFEDSPEIIGHFIDEPQAGMMARVWLNMPVIQG